jgi:hypothetical protein
MDLKPLSSQSLLPKEMFWFPIITAGDKNYKKSTSSL